MAHRRDAERIVKNLDGEKMAGEKVDIQHAKGKNLLVDPHFDVFFFSGAIRKFKSEQLSSGKI